jgi:uncharacterized protein
MPSRISRLEELFLDTAYTIALSSVTDAYHPRARELAVEIQTQQARLVTTQAVVLEIGNSLSKLRYRAGALSLLDAIEHDPNVEVVLLSEALYARGRRLFRERPDKEWSLTDCISFVVMEERGITKALTTDHHFVQAGFQALLP